MRKIYILGLTLFAALGFSAVAVASASAVEFLLAEWLIGGNPVAASTSSEAIGELLLEDLKTAIGAIGVLCVGSLDGTVNADGEDTITQALNAAKELIGAPLTGLALECVEEKGSCPSPLVWAENLPWNTLAELMVDGTEEFFVDLLLKGTGVTGNPAWEVECMGAIATSDLCEAAPEGISKLTNLTADVGAKFEEAFTELAGIKLATCTRSIGGTEENAGIVESDGEGLITATGGALSIFS